MPPANADDRNRSDDQSRPTPDRTAELTAVLVRYDCQPDECTLHPRGATGAELMRKWMSAQTGSYVALDAMR